MAVEAVLGAAKKAVGALTGGAQLIASLIAAKKAKDLRPQNVDPTEAAYAARINDMRMGARTGSIYSEMLRQLRNNAAIASQNVNEAAGGYSGAAIEGIAQTLGKTGDLYGDIVVKSQNEAMYYDNQYNDAIKQMIARKADLQSNDYANKLKSAADLKSAGFANLGVPLATAAGDAIVGEKTGDVTGDQKNGILFNMLTKVMAKKQLGEYLGNSFGPPTVTSGDLNPSFPQ
jgi:hypothetical protein